MHRILVRFNTKHEQDEGKRKWRVVINDVEHLADHVNIEVPCETIMENIHDTEKFHFLCHGMVVWNGNIATIVGPGHAAHKNPPIVSHMKHIFFSMCVAVSSLFWVGFFALTTFCVYCYSLNPTKTSELSPLILLDFFVLAAAIFGLVIVGDVAEKLQRQRE